MLALYSVIEFAADPERHITASQIANKYGVSSHHLAKVLAELVRADIVESAKELLASVAGVEGPGAGEAAGGGEAGAGAADQGAS